MKKPSYTLHITPEEKTREKKRSYKQSALEEMTTVQLRDICMREKIIQGILHPLDRRELIDTIMRYRGVEETRLIQKECEGGIERIAEVIRTKVTTERKADTEIRTPAHIILYPEQGLTLWDAYQIVLSENLTQKIGEGNVLLIGADRTLCTILQLEAKNKDTYEYYLTRSDKIPFHPFKQRDYHLLFFGKQESEYLYQVYYDEPRTAWAALTAYRVSLADVELRQVIETQEPLTIDFGTSNTAVGMYVGEDERVWRAEESERNIQLVSFVEDTGKEKKLWRMVPSMVSVEEVNKKQVRYVFGYEARGRLRSRYAEETYSVFYDIKRWIGSFSQQQEVTDAQGNTTFVKRKEILRAYFLFLIHAAEEQARCRFHRIQFTCPVRVREQFYRMIQEILPEYEMDVSLQMDEASAVVYNTIHNLIGKKQYEEGETIPSMILDCGGGTTDLTSCSFRIFNKRISYQIEIETVYQNGDTNFGGNNLTYRILQVLKIILAGYYTGQPVKIEALLDVSEQELYQFVDKEGIGALYKSLNAAYQKAEQVIPTRFRDYETGPRREYYLVRNNYYFLFDLAERVKQLLGKHPGIIRFGLEGESKEEGVIQIAHWDIIRWEQGMLKESAKIPPITLDERQLSLLLTGDIYGLLNQFLEKLYQTGELEDYALIKLSGQSCRIGLFREALKEFLPGKSIRFQQHSGKEQEEFKLACVKGAILYAQAKKSGMADILISYKLPQIPFSVSAYTHEQTEKVLIAALDRTKSHGFLSRHKQIRTLELFLKDERGELRYRYVYENQPQDYKAITYEQIQKQYPDSAECIPQDDTDTISDTEVKFFVFAAKDQWGFYLVPVMREHTQLYIGKDAFYQFENSLWETDFFDGIR